MDWPRKASTITLDQLKRLYMLLKPEREKRTSVRIKGELTTFDDGFGDMLGASDELVEHIDEQQWLDAHKRSTDRILRKRSSNVG